MGFNPFRTQDNSGLDVAIVVGFAVVIIGLVLWGFFG